MFERNIQKGSVMNIGSPVILGWETFSEDEAVDAAIDEFGRDPTTSVAYWALSSNGTENTHKLAYRSSIPAVRGSRSGLSSPRAMISGRVKA